MLFTCYWFPNVSSNTIDQPGKQISLAAHGKWLGGEPNYDRADAWLLMGLIPSFQKRVFMGKILLKN